MTKLIVVTCNPMLHLYTGASVLQALFLTSVVVSALTGYTFWASKKGKDFNYLGPLLFSCLMVLVMTGLVQVHMYILQAESLVQFNIHQVSF